jgi:DNA invertase Pin-like site-specific DNA recombinase
LPRGATGRLYTTEVSRATRGSLKDQGRVEEALQRAQILHVTRSGQYDLNKANDRFNWRIQASLASHELGIYKERVDAARVDMAHQGRLRTGKPPLGWDWDRNTKAPVPNARFPVVQAICRDALHLSTYELSEKYHIHPATIRNLLRNPFIAGWPAKRWFPHNGDRDWVGPSYLASSDQWIWPTQQADYPAACTLEEWHQIQQALAKRRDLREKRYSDIGWCRDIVRFRGYEHLQPRLGVWKCPGVRVLTYELAPRGVPRLYIAREAVHAAATAEILAILRDTEDLPGCLESARPKPQIPIADTGGTIRALEADLDDLMLLEGRYTRAGDEERLASLHRKQQAIEKEIKALRAQIIAAQSPIAIDAGTALVLLTIRDPAGFWERALNPERRIVANGLLERVLVAIEPRPRGFGTGYLREVVGVTRSPYFRHGE